MLDLMRITELRSTAFYGLLLTALSVNAPAFSQQGALVSQQHADELSQKDKDIGDRYLTAYQLCVKSEKLAAQKKWHEAINQAQQAERILAGIVRDHPRWKNNLVSNRRQIVATNLRDYRQSVKDSGARSPRQPIANRPEYFDPEGTRQLEGRVNLDRTPDINSGTIANSRQMYNELMRTREELRRMVVAYKDLRTKQTEMQKKLISAELNRDQYHKELTELKKSMTAERSASNEVVAALNKQLKELEEKHQREQIARQEAQKQVEELNTQLADLQHEHDRVNQEHAKLLAENAQLKEIVELNSPEKIKALLDQNITLSAQLKEAEARVEELSGQVSAHGDESSVLLSQLEQARGETQRLRDEMARIYDENLGYRRRISELTDSNAQLEKSLSEFDGQATADPALQEENLLLRSIVAKQSETLETQKKAQKLVLDAYRQMVNQNPQLLATLEQIDSEQSLNLTELESSLIKAVESSQHAADDQASAESVAAIRSGLEVEALATGAQKAFAAQRYTAAEQLYRTLVDAHPDHLAGLINLGSILLYRNKHEEAIEFLHRASRLAPEQATSYELAGTAYYLLDQLDAAAEQFRLALERDPANADNFFYLANIEIIHGNANQALKYLAAAVKLNPELGDAHYNMARIYIDLGKMADASRAYDRAIHHGASPDLDLENFLRERPESLGVPGEDLIAAVDPEEQALSHQKEQTQEGEGEAVAAVKISDTGDAAGAVDTPNATAKASLEILVNEPNLSVEEVHARIAIDIAAAPTPSPASGRLALEQDQFRSKQVSFNGQNIMLRVKPQFSQRLRSRGGPLPEASL